MTSENPTTKIKEENQCSSIIRGRIMNCFFFSNTEKDELKTVKSTSVRSWASSSSGCDMKRSGSEFNMSSEMSPGSIGRSTFPSFSQKPSNLRVFNYSELKTATKNFNRSLMIGEGGFGCVYRGMIKNLEDPHNKLDVAVKQLSRRGLQGHKEWVTEVNVLGVVEHPNLVKLVGYCAEDDERGIQRLLVYEYMPNRSVEDHLSTRSPAPLPWAMRLKIAQDAARGLAHLHEKMDFQIIFRDFKASNILLDEQWNAKLSDFGLARQGPSEGLSHVSTAVVGTIGYAAPEYVRTGRLTAKSDVWSYGVFLYELITGRRPLDRNRPKSEQNLLEWVKPYLSDGKKFQLILDPRLEGKCPLKSIQKLAAVANRCLVRYPKARPTMTEVLGMVDQIVAATDVGSIQPPITSLSTRNVGSPQQPTGSSPSSDVGSSQPSNRSLSTSDGGNPRQPIKSLSPTGSPKESNRKQSSSKRRTVDLGFCEVALSVWRKMTPKLIKAS